MNCLTTVAERGVAGLTCRPVDPAVARGGIAVSEKIAVLAVFGKRALSNAKHDTKNRRFKRVPGQWEIRARKALMAKGQSYECRDSKKVGDRSSGAE
jgi:hypothetical protein